MEGDSITINQQDQDAIFLSTPSGWRATGRRSGVCRCVCHFYPRPPGGGRRTDRPQAPGKAAFLSTPSGWRATLRTGAGEMFKQFLSTPSGWRATPAPVRNQIRSTPNFYPRPPGGGRPQPAPEQLQARAISIHALRVEGDGCVLITLAYGAEFLSTPSGWRATVYIKVRNILCKHFYPRPPGGGRHIFPAHIDTDMYFYPRPPGGGRHPVRFPVIP